MLTEGSPYSSAMICCTGKCLCEMDQFWNVHCAGDRSSGPSLLRKSASGCHFELLWYTASACAVGRHYGDNCQVNYPAMGVYLLLLTLAIVGFMLVCAMSPVDLMVHYGGFEHLGTFIVKVWRGK